MCEAASGVGQPYLWCYDLEALNSKGLPASRTQQEQKRMQRCAKHVGHACHMQIDRDRPFLHAWALAFLGGATLTNDGQTSQRDTIQHQL